MQGDPTFPKVQFPPAALCPLCRAPSLDNVSGHRRVVCLLLAAVAAPVKSWSLHECCLTLVACQA